MGMNLYITVVHRVNDPEKFLPLYHITAWGIPAIQTVVPVLLPLLLFSSSLFLFVLFL